MRVVYTHDIFSSQPYGGISRYFVELIGRMPENSADFSVLAGLHINQHLGRGELGAAKVLGLNVPALPHTRFLRHSANGVLERLFVNGGPKTVVHQTYYFRSPRPARGEKLVLTVHDMIHELFASDFADSDPTSRLKREYCERADRIIAVSESTKADLVRCFGVNPDKVAVVHHGVPSFVRTAPAQGASPTAPFLLYVGTRGGYKNFERLARAYAASERLKGSFRLVCFGGGRFTERERRLLDELKISSLVAHVDGDDARLVSLYSRARALVYPSLYEGFGFPPLEAMSLGCPVFCAKTSSLPEVVGEAGVYFDPANGESMLAALEGALFDDTRLRGLARDGRVRAGGFSWEGAARKTLEVYRACV